MLSLFSAITAAHRRGEDFALCTVIDQQGSAPRGSGARMAVFSDGTAQGTVGGGAVEYETIRRAKAALSDGQARTEHFILTPNDAADIGMVCGGNVSIRITPVRGDDTDFSKLLDALLPQLSRRTDSWLIERMGGASDGFDLYIDGQGLCLGDDAAAAAILPLLSQKPTLLQAEDGTPQLFAAPMTHAQTVYIAGGGHVAAELVPLLARVGFSVTVYEDREEFCQKERFPAADATVLGDFSAFSQRLSITASDMLVIMTRGHQADYEVLRQALSTDACYIGVIGSRKKVAVTRERLLADGFTEQDLSRIHSPIGLSIRAETPAEIAVSIAAELILERANHRD